MPFQRRQLRPALGATFAAALLAQTVLAQVAAKAPASSSPSVQQAIQLVTEGRCQQALPVLRKAFPHVVGKDLQYRATMAAVRCAMDLQDDETAATALLLLKHEFPGDPEVLYIATHYFSEMGMRAARELTTRAPSSFQARKLQAEDLESQGKNEDAAAVYNKILEENPKAQGIHYRLGQIFLAEAGSNGSTDQAKLEFQKELEVDPHDAASEFILGELARRAGQWDEAIAHFTRASTLDVGFAEAYLALGMSLNASGKFPEAVKPLENYVTMQPGDPAGHYQLAMSYARTGNKTGSTQQLALQAKAATSAGAATDTTEGHAVFH
jgi:tetratricopeptide (TPR) repeat protein